MPSEYDALLTHPQAASPYDALLSHPTVSSPVASTSPADSSDFAYPPDLQPSVPDPRMDEKPEVKSSPLSEQAKAIPNTARQTLAETGLRTAAGEEFSRAKAQGRLAKEASMGLTGPSGFTMPKTEEERKARVAGTKESVRLATEPALASAKDFSEQASDASEGQPKGALTTITKGLTKGAAMAAEAAAGGISLMATQGATEAYGAAKSAGKSDEEADTDAAKTLIGLAIFGGANKAVSSGITKLLGANPQALRTFLIQSLGQSAGNEATSRVISAGEAALSAPPGKRLEAAAKAAKEFNLEATAQNIGFGVMGGAHSAGEASARTEETKQDVIPNEFQSIPDDQFDAAIQQFKKLPDSDPRKSAFEGEIARRAALVQQGVTEKSTPATPETEAKQPPSEVQQVPLSEGVASEENDPKAVFKQRRKAAMDELANTAAEAAKNPDTQQAAQAAADSVPIIEQKGGETVEKEKTEKEGDQGLQRVLTPESGEAVPSPAPEVPKAVEQNVPRGTPVIDETVYHSTAHPGNLETEGIERTAATKGSTGIYTTPERADAEGWGGPAAQVRRLRVKMFKPFDVRDVPLDQPMTKEQLAETLRAKGLDVQAADIPGEDRTMTFDEWKPEVEGLTGRMRDAGFDGYVTKTTVDGKPIVEHVPFDPKALTPEEESQPGAVESPTTPSEEPIAAKKAPAEAARSVEGERSVESPSKIIGPAIRGEDGTIIAKGQIGDNHGKLKTDEIAKGNVEAADAEHVFHDENGNILTRQEAAQRALATGQITQEQFDAAMRRGDTPRTEHLKGLHSEDLTKEQPKADAHIEDHIISMLSLLGDDEPATPPEPAPAVAPEARQQRTTEETIALLREELKTAPQRDKKGIRDRISKLESNPSEAKPETPEEPASTGNDTLDEMLRKEALFLKAEEAKKGASGPKELWQMTRSEAADAEKKGFTHMSAVKEAVKRGETVPPEVLKDFKQYSWAREAMGGEPKLTKKAASLERGLMGLVEALKELPEEPKKETGIGSIYESTRHGEKKWMVQESDKRGFGDSIHDSKEAAEKSADLTKQRLSDRSESLAKLAAKSEKEAKEKSERENLDGFDEGMTPMRRGSVVKQLTTRLNYKGSEMTRMDIIRRLVAEGRTVTTEDGGRILVNDRDEYLGEKVLTKAGMDYAQWLIDHKGETPKVSKKKGEEGSTIIPTEIAERVFSAGKFAYEKGMDAAAWVGRMVKAFSEKIRPFLADAWNRIVEWNKQKGERGAIGDAGGSERKMGADRQAFVDSVGKEPLRAALMAGKEMHEAGFDKPDVIKRMVDVFRAQMGEKPFDESAARRFFDPSAEVKAMPRYDDPGEPPPKPSSADDTTALKKAVVNEQRQQRGEPEIPIPVRQSDEAMIDAARQRMAEDPTAVETVMSRIVDRGQKGITREDAALILAQRRATVNERNHWEDIAGNGAAPDSERLMARSKLDEIETRMDRLDHASRAAGSEWSDVGRMYQVDLRADYSREALERKARAKTGRSLSREESAKIKEQAETIAKLQEDAAAKANEHQEAQQDSEVTRAYEATIKDLRKQLAEKGKLQKEGSAKAPLSKRIVQFVESQMDAARQRIKDRKGKMFADPLGVMSAIDLADHALIGAGHIVKGVVKFADWSKEMVKEFGKEIQPHLEPIYNAAKEQAKVLMKQAREKTPAEAKAAAKADAVVGEELSGKTVDALVRAHILDGVHGEDAVMKAVHADIREAYPEATERDVRRAYSDYGKVRFPSREEVDVEMRELRVLARLQESIDRETEGLSALHTGLQRDKATQSIREKQKTLNELLKKRSGDPSPEQLASRDEAKQTALRNAIADLDKQLRTGEKPAERAPVADSPATEQLRAERDAMREKLAEIEAEANPPKTASEKQIEQLSKIRARLDDILSGKKDKTKAPDWNPLTAEAETIKSEIDAMRELAAQMRRDALPDKDPGAQSEAQQIKALEKSIDEYARRTAAKDFEPKGKKLGPDSAKVTALKEVRDSRRAMYEAVKKAGEPVRTPEEIYNARRMAQVQKQIVEAEARIKAGDFAPRPKKTPPEKTASVRRAEVKLAEKKNEIDRGLKRMEEAARPQWKKTLDQVAGAARFSALSGYHTLAKLASFDIARMIETPLTEATGAVLSKVPGFRGIFDKSTMEKGNFSKDMAKFYTGLATTGMKQAARVLRSGKSENALLYGKKEHLNPKWYDFFGTLHQALKTPLLTGSFEMYQKRGYEAAIRHGLDPSDEFVKAEINRQAYEYSQSSILQENNKFADAVNHLHARIEAANPKSKTLDITNHVISTMVKTLLTKGIVRTPANYIAQTIARTPIGLLTGLSKAAVARYRGVGNLHPTEANAVSRLVKVGAVGSAFFLLGAIDSTKKEKDRIFGGYWEPGRKRNGADVDWGKIRIDGKQLPHIVTHNPLTESAQMGSTMMRVALSKLRKSDVDQQGVLTGAVKAIVGLATKAPVASPVMRMGQDRVDMSADIVKGLVPQLIQNIAEDTDSQERSPSGMGEELKSSVPGLRQTVPTKASKAKRPRRSMVFSQ